MMEKYLSVEHDSCRVQFDSLELGVELVTVMEFFNILAFLFISLVLILEVSEMDYCRILTPQVNGHSDFCGPRVYTPSGHLENATIPVNMLVNPIKDSGLPRNSEQVPSKLITSRVATFLMIQLIATVCNRSTEMVEAFYSVNRFGLQEDMWNHASKGIEYSCIFGLHLLDETGELL
ncbi:hypothetical protein V6N11_003816 [Hibiscus sabdariffa]|uniref:Uncharacterized protein n=1 Tax=Hibiscus sabdariffa TaxID=183260 RepID=A0ABR2SF39_9ROSI